jgi:RNA polymerase sigma-70 factor, ECF subfamily
VSKAVQTGKLPRRSESGTADLPEAEAIRLAQQGDPAAFEHLYRLHCRRAYTLCFKMVRDPTEAEDLTQEVFLQVFRKIHTFRNESAFSTWLHRLAFNVVLMRLRKKTLAVTSLEDATGPDEENGRPPKDFGEPDLRLAGLVDRLNLDRAIAKLPPGYRLIFELHDVQGYEHNEIAEILGHSVGNSKSQLHKARMRLRQELQGDKPNYSAQFSVPMVRPAECRKPSAALAICHTP